MYYPEEPKRINGRMMTWEYKLLNYLVQGSAADVTKESIIRWYNHPERHPQSRLLVTVYDETNLTSLPEYSIREMAVLKWAMETIEMDVKMLSSPKWGISWGSVLKPKGEQCEFEQLKQFLKDEFGNEVSTKAMDIYRRSTVYRR